MKNKAPFNWLLRFIKGMLIGTGAILPGLSGGALAAIFGFYERMIAFIAHLGKNFKKNFFYFAPVLLGALFGIFALSYALSYFFEKAEAEILWFFVGCIAGTAPALYRQATKKGREKRHTFIMLISAAVTLFVLYKAQDFLTGAMPQNFWTWLLAGGIFALGMIVPGLSPSNFLVYLGMYKPMTDGIKSLDLTVIIPIGIGGIVTIIALSKLINTILNRSYTGMFHMILGVVFASTVIIIPTNYNYLSAGAFVCLAAFAGGVALGAWMSRLEEDYKD